MTTQQKHNLPYLVFVCLVSALGGFLFALMCVPAICIAWKLIPETKGKTLEEIERFWLKSGT